MWRRVTELLVVGLLAVSISMPWAFLQSIAWTGMLLRYSTQTSLSDAVRMTFDGKHPCKLCHIVKQSKATEKKRDQDMPSAKTKLDLALAPVSLTLCHPSVPPPGQRICSLLPGVEWQPPHPPPRCA